MFIKDDMSFIFNEAEGMLVKHQLYDTDFSEEIVIYSPHQYYEWTEKYLDRFIAIYELKGIEVIPNLIKYMMQEMIIADKSEYVKYVIDNHPQYADEMIKYMVLL